MSEACLREALDAMPHKVWMVRPDGPAIYYNRAMREFAGEALSLPDRPSREKALIHPDDLGRVAVARDRAMVDNRDWATEVRLKCPNGSWRWHQLNFSMLWGQGQVDAWLATSTDIHDLRQALQVAQESSEQLRLAAEAAQLGIYSFDLQTREHVWSPELRAIFGLSPTAAVPWDILRCIHPDDRERLRTLCRQSFDPKGSAPVARPLKEQADAAANYGGTEQDGPEVEKAPIVHAARTRCFGKPSVNTQRMGNRTAIGLSAQCIKVRITASLRPQTPDVSPARAEGPEQGPRPVLLMTDTKNVPDLPPRRIAALRKWLHAANARLLSMEHARRDLISAASVLLDRVGSATPGKRSARGVQNW